MKKLVIILMGMSACAYAQLEQQYQRGSYELQQGNGDYYHVEPQNSCVLPIQRSENVNTHAQQNDAQACQNNPETCNCLNHSNGSLVDEPYTRGSECVPVRVYENNVGEKQWYESGEYEDYWWCKDPENGSPNHNKNKLYYIIDDSNPANRGYQGENVYQKRNPEGGLPDEDINPYAPYKGN